jgi:CheY-like chemotaxis protein
MNNYRLLIIDDDQDDMDILKEALLQCGVEQIHHVGTVMQAFIYLQSVEKQEDLPKLIVTDQYLPGITGTEFIADMKQMDKYKHIHVVVLSGNKSENEIQAFKKMGADDYLVKPNSYVEYVEVARKLNEKIAAIS